MTHHLNAFEKKELERLVPSDARHAVGGTWQRGPENHEVPPWCCWMAVIWPLVIGAALFSSKGKDDEQVFILFTWVAMAYFYVLPAYYSCMVVKVRDIYCFQYESILIWNECNSFREMLTSCISYILLLSLMNVDAFRTAGVFSVLYVVSLCIRSKAARIIQNELDLIADWPAPKSISIQ
ncbi:MAG TPA: hypothetical protein VK255_03320 [Patescibacteria group bacterium]|nr:hypothetical protein [Patescibacteria group bacterium]